jgi:ASC-1-like (ASCH) protein
MVRQVGKDEEPIEMSKKENVDTFFKDLETWGKKMAGDKEQEYRNIYLSQKEQSYGVASA